MSNTPEFKDALNSVLRLLQVKGGNFLTWMLLAMIGSAPLTLPIINQNRGPGSPTYLNEADFHIIGPDRAPVGELVRCTVADYAPSDVAWFTVGDSEKYGLNDSNLVFSVPSPGEVTVTCAIIREGRLYLTQKVIVIGGDDESPDEPQPRPEPTPEPEPEPEPGLDEVGEQIMILAGEYNIGRSESLQIAKNLRQAVKGSSTPRALVEKTVELNSDVDLSEEANEGIAVLLQTLAEDGRLVSMEQHRMVWESMAKGFEHYAKVN